MGNSLFAIVMLLALVVLVLIFAVIALARQIGILHTRLAPAGALMTTAGPKVGQPAPVLAMSDIKGAPLTIGGPSKKAKLIMFVSPTCPICKDLVPMAVSMAKSEKLELVFGSDGGQTAKHEEYIKRMKIEDYPYIVSMDLGMKFEVGKLPYAVLLDEKGVLRSKGLVNSREHLESLVNAMQSGYESVQEYLVKTEHQFEEIVASKKPVAGHQAVIGEKA
ncbi:MAG: methylamine dehydrogenase accessory protein MauD [Pseudohongiella sp.]|nr:methylamine dehydrogenase accessory protein MauD [Pseudohongiella sp.]MDO9519454.1 methylamine dehydrogenase accessory protein MauD [Pseudohongiella sp.]MDP2127538.1 methylamine dehydrogenase accessory protein MauD [Pseudohongiella sp.]